MMDAISAGQSSGKRRVTRGDENSLSNGGVNSLSNGGGNSISNYSGNRIEQAPRDLIFSNGGNSLSNGGNTIEPGRFSITA